MFIGLQTRGRPLSKGRGLGVNLSETRGSDADRRVTLKDVISAAQGWRSPRVRYTELARRGNKSLGDEADGRFIA